MKIIHTSDWHLGQKFISRERDEEHSLALDWLVETISKEKIDALIVAGDIFDISNPPNSAQTLYFTFLKKLHKTSCRHVVITGGNHDSPLMLNAPKELLQLLDVHVVGCVTENPEDEIIQLRNEKEEVECVVAAVPFLRDQDIRKAIPGESIQDREERTKQGIVNHFREVGKLAESKSPKDMPIIATGHLYATGAKASDKQDNIYLGNLENINAEQFPKEFDYVALGHIHRPQAVGKMEHIRYSGSLIPLSFSETKDDKVVVCVEFSGKSIKSIREIQVPLFRRLKSVETTYDKVFQRLDELHENYKDGLATWLEVTVESDTAIPNLDNELREYLTGKNIDLLRTRLQLDRKQTEDLFELKELGDLSPIDVFTKKCESAGIAPENMDELLQTFKELEVWRKEQLDAS